MDIDSLKPSSASKLPIKRKTPHYSGSNSTTPLSPKTELLDPSISTFDFIHSINPPPFKFHRIWTEPDEIRFLQGLLDSASLGFSFPRDLPLFYDNFSNTMSQPYSKYQLSEKLRRLRKKFRVTSSRISRGLSVFTLSLHDRNLYELSTKLWSPEYLPTSPFGKNGRNDSLLGVTVSFSRSLQGFNSNVDNAEENFVNDVDVDMGYDFGERTLRRSGGGIGVVVARSALNVFDECLKEIRVALARQGVLCPDSKDGKRKDFEGRWKEQQMAELDVLSRRLSRMPGIVPLHLLILGKDCNDLLNMWPSQAVASVKLCQIPSSYAKFHLVS